MKIFTLFFHLGIGMMCSMAGSQEWGQNFDDQPYSTVRPPNQARQCIDRVESTLTAGLKGRALDLRAPVAKRLAVVCTDMPVNYAQNFSVSFWLKTDSNANPAGILAANGDKDTYGWQIEALERGTWRIQLTDGQHTLDYAPPQQKINDSLWHQLSFSVDQQTRHAKFYFDGKNVAIYNLAQLQQLRTARPTSFGGNLTDMKETFNGCLDEIKVVNRVRDAAEIEAEFNQYQPQRRRNKVQIAKHQIRCLTWNIWHGGRETGNQIGPQRVIDIIKSINPDVVGIVETFGSGPILADALGYQLYLISPNLSILSRYPLEEIVQHDAHPACSGAAKVRINANQSIIFNATWLGYLPDFLLQIGRNEATNTSLEQGEINTRMKDIAAIMKYLTPYLADADKTPVVLAGDFNVASHLDWKKEYRDLHRGLWVNWPVSRHLEQLGFIDTYRELHRDVRQYEARSWCVWAVRPQGNYFDYPLQARVDFIYLLGGKAVASDYLDDYKLPFPSDHGLFYTDIKLPETALP